MTLYTCIVADPPWAPRDKLPGPTRGAARQYPVLSTTELLVFPLPPIADDAVLFLWRLGSMQEDALAVATAWEFRVSSEVVWNKLTKNGLPHFGMGHTVRASHETCLVCVRGRASRVIVSRSVRSTFAAPMPVDQNGRYIHSAKPPEFFSQIVEPLVGPGAPKLELFARTRRAGWDAIGNQLEAA
jgi:N6-adenosine-specific RNA methylase IME4